MNVHRSVNNRYNSLWLIRILHIHNDQFLTSSNRPTHSLFLPTLTHVFQSQSIRGAWQHSGTSSPRGSKGQQASPRSPSRHQRAALAVGRTRLPICTRSALKEADHVRQTLSDWRSEIDNSTYHMIQAGYVSSSLFLWGRVITCLVYLCLDISIVRW